MFRLATLPLRKMRAFLHLFVPVACYVMWEETWFPGRYNFKIGISNEPVRRNKELKRDLHNGVVLAFWVPIPRARKFEQILLRLPLFGKTHMPYHSGQTEWRKASNPITAFLLACLAYAYGGNVLFVFTAVLILPLPLDILLIFIIAAAAWYALLGGLIYGAWLVVGRII